MTLTDGLAPGSPLRGAVLLLGNFDGLHLGHQALVRHAREVARGRPVALMSCEPHPRSFFAPGGAPFRLATPRTKPHLLAPHGIDFIFAPRFDATFAGLSPKGFVDEVLIDRLGLSTVIAGADFRFGRGRAGDMDLLADLGRRYGLSVASTPDVSLGGQRISSSLIREALRAGDLGDAMRLLGAGWLVDCARTGDGGLVLDPALCRPRAGIYLGRPATSAATQPTRIAIHPDGHFVPLGPRSVDDLPTLWTLERQE